MSLGVVTSKNSFSTSLFTSQWIPASKSSPKSKQKLMIVLHGRGDSIKAFFSIKKELRLPNMNYLLLQAPRKFDKGYSWSALEPRRTNALKSVRAKLFSLVDELTAAGWKTQDVYWMGHSQGCLVASDLVLNHEAEFGGLVGVSGYIYFFPGWKKAAAKSGACKTPWLITHGIRDRVIYPDEIREDVLQLMDGEVPVLYREFFKGHDFDHQNEVPFIRDWIRRPRHQRLKAGREAAREPSPVGSILPF